MSARPWYKRYGADFVHGCLGLTLEEKGAYSLCLDLIYDRGAPIPDDARWLAGVCGVSLRKWSAIRARLIEAGKITIVDGHISNRRAEKEIENSARTAQKHAENGSKGGLNRAENDRARRENNELDEASLKHHVPDQKPEARSQNRSSLRSERVNGSADQIEGEFAIFWAAYPRREGSNPKAPALQCYRRCRKRGISAEMMLDAVRQYAKERAGEPPRFTVQATTWLNQSRWEQESAPLLPQKPADPPEWASMRGSDPSDWPSSLPPFLIVAKAYTAGNWASAWGPEPDYGGCRLPIDLQRRLAVERFGEDVARRRSPRLFAVAA